MNNYSGKLNLLKLKNACIITIQGKAQAKRGVFIPIEDNNLFISADENLKAKGAYLDFNAWENQQPSKYGDTHSLRQSLPKELRDKMTDEELKAVPYFGNMKPFVMENSAQTVEAPVTKIETEDELPF